MFNINNVDKVIERERNEEYCGFDGFDDSLDMFGYPDESSYCEEETTKEEIKVVKVVVRDLSKKSTWVKTFFNIEQCRVGSKLITIDGKSREVSIDSIDGPNIVGKVGEATFKWSCYYNLPMVSGGKGNIRQLIQYRPMIKKFILQHISSPSISPIQTEEYTGSSESQVNALYDQLISGVPVWLKEDGNKVWTPCYSRKDGTFLYMRRTRYTEDGAALAKLALPTCRGCNKRTECTKPCQIIEALIK